MLKTRVIPTVLYKPPTLVKGISYNSWRRVGYPMQAIKVYNLRDVDELIILDIAATQDNRTPDFSLIDEIADECFMPLTVGGGIKNIEDIKKLLSVGADKISMSTSAVINSSLINEASHIFGSQCIVISIDVKLNSLGKYEVYTHSGKNPTGINPIVFAKEVEKRGAGEILISSIDLDGTMKGYDIELIKIISESVSIPVIASGGAGNYNDMLKALKMGKASAVAAASIFHFTEQTPLEAKIYLKENGINTRVQI